MHKAFREKYVWWVGWADLCSFDPVPNPSKAVNKYKGCIVQAHSITSLPIALALKKKKKICIFSLLQHPANHNLPEWFSFFFFSKQPLAFIWNILLCTYVYVCTIKHFYMHLAKGPSVKTSFQNPEIAWILVFRIFQKWQQKKRGTYLFMLFFNGNGKLTMISLPPAAITRKNVSPDQKFGVAAGALDEGIQILKCVY